MTGFIEKIRGLIPQEEGINNKNETIEGYFASITESLIILQLLERTDEGLQRSRKYHDLGLMHPTTRGSLPYPLNQPNAEVDVRQGTLQIRWDSSNEKIHEEVHLNVIPSEGESSFAWIRGSVFYRCRSESDSTWKRARKKLRDIDRSLAQRRSSENPFGRLLRR